MPLRQYHTSSTPSFSARDAAVLRLRHQGLLLLHLGGERADVAVDRLNDGCFGLVSVFMGFSIRPGRPVEGGASAAQVRAERIRRGSVFERQRAGR
jgi:hypothetical protein